MDSIFKVFSELKTANEKELKPCPFCGGEAAVVYGACDYNVFQVSCGKCSAYAGWNDKSDDAINAWNKRA